MQNIFDFFSSAELAQHDEYDCREGCSMRLFDGMSAQRFDEYIAFLENADFRVLQKRELDGNLFAALKSEKEQVNVLFTPCSGEMRVTVSEKDQTPNFTGPECKGECETVFYGFENDQTMIDCGMCLLIQCPDYSFFVVDSGHYFQFNDNDRIHKFMRDRTPEG